MKLSRPFIPALVLFCCFLFTSPSAVQAQQFEHGGQYMDYLFGDHPQYQQSLWSYIKAAAHSKNARKVEKRRRELVTTAYDIKKKVSRQVPYEGDASLRDALATYFDLTYKVLKEDYAKIVDMEAIAEESYDAMEAYILAKEKANDKVDEAGEQLEAAQKAFAAAHNIELVSETSETDKKLEEASAVYHYYNQLYLIFFKSYKQEAYLLTALESNDVNALIQNQNSLKSFALEGLSKLDTVQKFKGDGSIIDAGKEVMGFYLMEADEKVPILANLYLVQDKMEKVQASFEAIQPAKRTQGDVDTYNQVVADYNQAVNDFNDTIQSLNKDRSSHLDNWNKTTDRFIDTHIP
jgi:hypothetical protein